jgi:uncharacterized membrane protein YqhA
MRSLFRLSRYVVVLAVLGLLAAAGAVLLFGAITTATMIGEAFSRAQFNGEGARLLSLEMIEIVDLFLLGTILLVTAIGLYQLFIDPRIPLPGWLSAGNLEDLKGNLVAVVVVMLLILFLGAVAGRRGEEAGILDLGAGVTVVLLAIAAVVLAFQRVVQAREKRAAREPEAGARGR